MIQARSLLRRPNSELQRSDTIIERFIAQSWTSCGEIATEELYKAIPPKGLRGQHLRFWISSLFAAERGYGIYFGCAARREPPGYHCHQAYDSKRRRERDRVDCVHCEELMFDDPCGHQGKGQAEASTDGKQEERLTQNHVQHICPLCAEGEADTDLIGAASNVVAHDAVKSDGSQQQREDRKDAGERGDELIVGDQVRDLVVNCCDM